MMAYGMWPAMMLSWLLFLGLVVVGVVLIVRSLSYQGRSARGSRALDILDERFARGELDQKDYDDRRRILRGGH